MKCPSCNAEVAPRATFCAGCGARIPDPLADAVIDGRYQIERRIATGGFGAIYRAVQITTGRNVAIKVMHADLAADANLVARFRREGVVLCNLRDAHTVTTYELGELPDGRQFIVMELLEGKTLLEVFRAGGPLPWQRMFAIARDMCSALAEAHSLGIVHRDLKPPNIFLETLRGDDFVKVLDFGIAKIMQDSGLDDQSELTAMGQAVGTLEYMAPEQLMGGKCDGRTDIYTLGVVMFEMITGRRPFSEALGLDLMSIQLTHQAPLASTRLAVPPEVDAVLARCLSQDAEDRFPDVAALAAALTAAIGPVKRRDPTPPPITAAPRVPTSPPAPPRVPTQPGAPPPQPVRRALRDSTSDLAHANTALVEPDAFDSHDTVLEPVGDDTQPPSLRGAALSPLVEQSTNPLPRTAPVAPPARPSPPPPVMLPARAPTAMPARPSPPPPGMMPSGPYMFSPAQQAPAPPRRQLHPAVLLALLCLLGIAVGAALALWV